MHNSRSQIGLKSFITYTVRINMYPTRSVGTLPFIDFSITKTAMRFAPLILLLSWFYTTPAAADLRICNQSQNSVAIAIGFRSEKGWQSEGWWLTEPENCAVVFEGPLDEQRSQYFYIHAVDDIGGNKWDGRIFMCSRDESFTIFGEKDCLARGYERTGFMEVDTKKNRDWTVQLTDADLQ